MIQEIFHIPDVNRTRVEGETWIKSFSIHYRLTPEFGSHNLFSSGIPRVLLTEWDPMF